MFRTVSRLAGIGLSDVRNLGHGRTASLFAASELKHYRSRPAASVAAAIAVKHAVADLLADLCPGASVSFRAIRVGHSRSGAPVLRGCPASPLGTAAQMRAQVRISVSHTRTHAFGLAALCTPIERGYRGR